LAYNTVFNPVKIEKGQYCAWQTFIDLIQV